MNGISDEHFHKWVPKQWRYRGYHQIIHVDHQGMFQPPHPGAPGAGLPEHSTAEGIRFQLLDDTSAPSGLILDTLSHPTIPKR